MPWHPVAESSDFATWMEVEVVCNRTLDPYHSTGSAMRSYSTTRIAEIACETEMGFATVEGIEYTWTDYECDGFCWSDHVKRV